MLDFFVSLFFFGKREWILLRRKQKKKWMSEVFLFFKFLFFFFFCLHLFLWCVSLLTIPLFSFCFFLYFVSVLWKGHVPGEKAELCPEGAKGFSLLARRSDSEPDPKLRGFRGNEEPQTLGECILCIQAYSFRLFISTFLFLQRFSFLF